MGSNDEVQVDAAVGSLSSAGIGSLDRVGLLGTGVQLLNPFRLVDVRPEPDIGRTVVGGSKMRSLTDGKSQGGAKQVVSIIVGLTLKSLLVVVLLLLRTRAGVVNGAIILLFPNPFGRNGVPTTLLLPTLLVPVVLVLELLLLSYRLLIEDERRNSVSSDLITPLVGKDGE